MINFNTEEEDVFVISIFSFWANSSASFLNHLILVGSGFEINLLTNSAVWPSLIETFSTLVVSFGKSIGIIFKYKKLT